MHCDLPIYRGHHHKLHKKQFSVPFGISMGRILNATPSLTLSVFLRSSQGMLIEGPPGPEGQAVSALRPPLSTELCLVE